MADFVLDDESVFQLGDPDQEWQNHDTAWQPTGPGSLTDFYGENAKGTWTLDVCDIKPVVGHGYLSCWNLELLDYRSLNFVKETYEVNESDGMAMIEVELSETTRDLTEVTYTTIPASGSNQVVASDTLAFSAQTTSEPGDIKKSFTIPITDDDVDEADEVVMIKLSNPTNDFFIADPGSAQLIIRDDDSQAATASLFVNVVGSGTVSRSPDKERYEIGEQVMLTAEPDSGHIFRGWSGDLSGSQNPAQLTMDGERTVLATFIPERIDGISAYFLPSIVRP
jgi:hypothetical protein